jgi:hypothetical protein
MKEGLSAIDEAVRFLRAAPPERSLTLSPECVARRPIIVPIRLAGARAWWQRPEHSQ